jgi:ribonuclease HI
MEKQIVTCYTDGSCLGNPGVGGFAAIIKANGINKIVKGYSKSHCETNNSMELKAVLHAVEFCMNNVKKPAKIQIMTDSQYVCSCWNHDAHWLSTSERPNHGIWIQIIKCLEKSGHEIEMVKIPGHAGLEYNERADKIAREQAVAARHIIFGGNNGRR